MRSDVPIGSTLSGGLDSSAVVSAISHISENSKDNIFTNNWMNLFNSSFPNSFNDDEFKWAKKVADQLSIPIIRNVIDITKSEFDLNKAFLAQVEDPYLTLPFPMLNTYKNIKNKGISIMTLDGHGSDELFCGYGHIKKSYYFFL